MHHGQRRHAGGGQNPARQAALNGGLPDHVAALTINKVCGSDLKAVMLAAQGIATGDIEVVVAGGMESMSNAPYLLPRAREGTAHGRRHLVDSLITTACGAVRELPHGHDRRGRRREVCVRREEQDQLRPRATASGACDAAGWFKDEILPIDAAAEGRAVRRRHGRADPRGHDARGARQAETGVQKDGPSPPATLPASTTAAALVVMAAEKARAGLTPMARIVAQASSGLPPKLVMMTPVEAVESGVEKVGGI